MTSAPRPPGDDQPKAAGRPGLTWPRLDLRVVPLRALLTALLTLAVLGPLPRSARAEPAPSPEPTDLPTVPEPDNRRPCRPLGPNDTLRLDADALPLSDLVRIVACALDRNLMVTPPTLGQGLITVLAPRPLSRRDLLTVWHTALAANNLLEERRGAVYLVRPMRPTPR